ncbi:MAG: hypothetical protein OXI81_16325 [Paracoccaceae bacterium]|nr:hypothetical protein [Paracoccaceae bacterium]
MSSDLNGSADVRPAPVKRGEAEWTNIMVEFERWGMSQREFCESRGLSLKTFANWRCRLDRGGRRGSFVELAPPAVSGWDVELDLGSGVVLAHSAFVMLGGWPRGGIMHGTAAANDYPSSLT